MRKTVLVFPLCAAGLILASCVTAPAAKTPVAELFDSAAVPPSARERPDDRFPLPEPSIAGLPAESPVPASSSVAAGRPDATSAASSASAAALAAPAPAAAVPVTPALPDSPGLIPLSPPKAAKFPLAAPVAPPVPPKKQTTPPARQAAPQPLQQSGAVTAAPKPAAAPPGTGRSDASAAVPGSASRAGGGSGGAGKAAAAVDAGASVSAAAAPAAAPAGAAATTAPAAAGNSYGRLREIYARQGDELQVGLDGIGFLFLGFPDRSPLADGMSFKGKEIRNSKTWFTFQALKLGTYDLDFLQQENRTGKSDKETVRVHVLTEQDFSAAVNQQPGQGGGDAAAVETGDAAFAGRLSSVGAYASALAELQKGYREGNPVLNDQIASLYMKMGSYDSAGKYYTRNLAPPNDYTARAVVGLVSIAVAQKDQKALMASLKQFLSIRDPSAEEPLIRAIRMETDRSEIGIGLDLAGEYVARYPRGKWRDEADFLTANLLEGDSQFRDIARARALYRAILDNDPESAFAAAAREHLSYIDRHFYQVR